VQPFILADPNVPGRMYCVANDDPDNNHGSGDDADVFISISANNGVNWGAPTRIDDTPGTGFSVMPTAGIDATNGCIFVHYYDNRNGATNANARFLLDVFGTSSTDGGLTWTPSGQINNNAFDPDPGAPNRFNGPPPTTRIGEYNGVAVADGIAFGVWCGNTVDGGGNPTGHQTIFDRFAFDTVAPTVACPINIVVECTTTGGTPATNPAIAAFLAAATATDDPAFFPLGTTTVTFTAVDDAGNSGSCNASVKVQDTTPPMIACPADITVECSATGGTPKNDPQLIPFFAGVSANDVCDPSPVITDDAPAFFPLGTRRQWQPEHLYGERDGGGHDATNHRS
jgi:hypothetical protein